MFLLNREIEFGFRKGKQISQKCCERHGWLVWEKCKHLYWFQQRYVDFLGHEEELMPVVHVTWLKRSLLSQADGLCTEADDSVYKIQELNWQWQAKNLIYFFPTPLPHFWWWTLWYHDHPIMLAAVLTKVLTAHIYPLQLCELNNPEGENESLY